MFSVLTSSYTMLLLKETPFGLNYLFLTNIENIFNHVGVACDLFEQLEQSNRVMHAQKLVLVHLQYPYGHAMHDLVALVQEDIHDPQSTLQTKKGTQRREVRVKRVITRVFPYLCWHGIDEESEEPIKTDQFYFDSKTCEVFVEIW